MVFNSTHPNIGKDDFILAYNSTNILPLDGPAVRFNREATAILKMFADQRNSKATSRNPLHPLSDLTGLLGELATYRYLGISAERAWEMFSSGIKGDNGIDLEVTNV